MNLSKKTKIVLGVIIGSIVLTFGGLVGGHFIYKANNIKYKVTFDTDNGSKIEDQTIKSGGTITIPAFPKKKDFKFAGWYLDKQCSKDKQFYYDDPIKSDLTIYAKWVNANDYNIVSFSYGKGQVYPAEVMKNELIAKPEDPTYPGYRFGGWFNEVQCYEAFRFDLPISEDVTTFAKWDAEGKATVTFSYGDKNKSFHVEKVDIGKTAPKIIPDSQINPGYDFSYWCTNKLLTHEYDFNAPITKSIILYAKWTQQKEYVTEEQYKKSFENLVNITENRPLNYFANGSTAMSTNGNLDYRFENLVVKGDRETMIVKDNNNVSTRYFTQKDGYYSSYIKETSEDTGEFVSIRETSVREQLASIYDNFYTDYPYLTYSPTTKNFTYNEHSVYPEEGEYLVNTQMTFYEECIQNMSCKYIHKTNDKTVEILISFVYEYNHLPEGEEISMPTKGDWKNNIKNRNNDFKDASGTYKSEQISNFSGYQTLNLGIKTGAKDPGSDSLPANLQTLKCYNGTNYVAFPAKEDILAVRKNKKLLKYGDDYSHDTDNYLKFNEKTKENDEIQILLKVSDTATFKSGTIEFC